MPKSRKKCRCLRIGNSWDQQQLYSSLKANFYFETRNINIDNDQEIEETPSKRVP